MSISAVGSPPPAPVSSKPASAPPVSSEKAEGAGPDRDADGDEAVSKAPVQAATAPGTGAVVNKSA